MSAFELDTSGPQPTLRLSGELTVEHAGALHAALVEAGCPAAALQVDASGAARLDASILQILLAAAGSSGQARLLAASDGWRDAYSRFGVNDPFSSAPASSA